MAAAAAAASIGSSCSSQQVQHLTAKVLAQRRGRETQGMTML
jgi:hypothetical protein